MENVGENGEFAWEVAERLTQPPQLLEVSVDQYCPKNIADCSAESTTDDSTVLSFGLRKRLYFEDVRVSQSCSRPHSSDWPIHTRCIVFVSEFMYLGL